MIDFQNFYRAYVEADDALARRETAARSNRTRDRWMKLRRMNDYAYFTMLFAQFEHYLNEQCFMLITRRKNAKTWRDRRAWDGIEAQHKPDGTFDIRLGFMRRVALLVDKAAKDYADLSRLYDLRCQIAHGQTAAVGSLVLHNEANIIRRLKSRIKA